MTSGLATGGYISPGFTGGGGGGQGASGVAIPFELRDTNGVMQAGVDLSGAGVVQLSLFGAPLANRLGAAPTSIGGGYYYYILDIAEVVPPWVILRINLNGYKDPGALWDTGSVSATALSAAQAALTDAILNSAVDVNGHTSSQVTSAISAIDAHTDTQVATAVAAIDVHTDSQVAAAVVAIDAHTDGVVPNVTVDNTAIARAVWQLPRASNQPAGSFGEILDAKVSATLRSSVAVATATVSSLLLEIGQGDLDVPLNISLVDQNGTAVDVSDSTGPLILHWIKPGGSTVDVALTNVSLADGTVRRAWISGDTTLVGLHRAQVIVPRAGGQQTFPMDSSYYRWVVHAKL